MEPDVIEWVDPPKGAERIPSRLLYRWKFDHSCVPNRQKSRVVVQGFHEADAGADKAAPVVASSEAVRKRMALAATNHWCLI